MALLTSFEQLRLALEELPQSYFELDGSFLWTGEDEQGSWRVDGMIYDANGESPMVRIERTVAKIQLDGVDQAFG